MTAPAAESIDTVLIVEDEPGVRRALELWLKNHNVPVAAFPDSTTALHYLSSTQEAIGVALIDAGLRGKSGFDFAREMLSYRPEATLLIMSGYVREDIRKQCEEMHAGVLEKPFDLNSLLTYIREHARKRAT